MYPYYPPLKSITLVCVYAISVFVHNKPIRFARYLICNSTLGYDTFFSLFFLFCIMGEIPTIIYNTSAKEITEIYKTDLTGKVAIVTGANSGIGLETAHVLASVHAKVIIPCRTLEKSNSAIQFIKKTVPEADLIPLQLDLSDLSSIKSFVDSFLQLNLPLNLLINNAGIMGPPKTFTKDGFESQFGVNYLGHFYLTHLLTNKLKSSAPSRIVNVSSSGNYYFCSSEGLDFTNLNAEKYYSRTLAYGQSKLANILHAKELQRRFDREGVDVIVTSVHPGAVITNLANSSDGLVTLWDTMRRIRSGWTFVKELIYLKKPEVGASTSVYCAVSPDVVKGKHYIDNAESNELLNEQVDNEDMAKELWDISEKLVLKE